MASTATSRNDEPRVWLAYLLLAVAPLTWSGNFIIHLLPLFSALLAVLVLDEALRVYHPAGAVPVFTGIYLTTSSPRTH